MMDDKAEKPEPCKCGRAPTIIERRDGVYIMCFDGRCVNPRTGLRPNLEDAIGVWNRMMEEEDDNGD
jgi:hypothetical protein